MGASSLAQIGLDDRLVHSQGLSVAHDDDPAGFKHITNVGQFKRHLGNLLDDQDSDPLPVEADDDLHDLLD